MAATDVLSISEAATAVGGRGGRWDDVLPALVTATSRRLDELVGPVVQRTVANELLDGGGYVVQTRLYPITSITSITEYRDTTGTALSAESNASKPTNAYLVDLYGPDVAFLDGTIRRRTAGADAVFPDGRQNVDVTYVAGRYADTSSVAERFKEAARLILRNLIRGQQGLASTFGGAAAGGGEVTDAQRIVPGFAVPNAVRELLRDELQDGVFAR